MKYYLLFISLLISLIVKSQNEERLDNYSESEYNFVKYPNTNMSKSSLAFYLGVGYMQHTEKLVEFFKPSWDGTMSLDYYSDTNMTFSLSIMGTAFANTLRKDVIINNNLWTPIDTATFWSYGLSVGYSILNKIHWRINPFLGIVLSQSELDSPSGNKYKIGAKPSPAIGINFSYRFINVNEEKQESELSGCWGINARITYVPFAVYKKEVPFSGGIWYMTIGVTVNFFRND